MLSSIGTRPRPGLCMRAMGPRVVAQVFPRSNRGFKDKYLPRAGSAEGGFCTSWLQATLGLSIQEAERVVASGATKSKTQVLSGVDCLLRMLNGEPLEVATVLRKQPALLGSDLDAWMGLFKQLDASNCQVARLVKEFGYILTSCTAQRAHALVALLRTFGMQDAVIRNKLLCEFPQLMALDLDTQVLPALDIMRHLFAHHDAAWLASKAGEPATVTSKQMESELGPARQVMQQQEEEREDPEIAATRMLLESSWRTVQGGEPHLPSRPVSPPTAAGGHHPVAGAGMSAATHGGHDAASSEGYFPFGAPPSPPTSRAPSPTRADAHGRRSPAPPAATAPGSSAISSGGSGHSETGGEAAMTWEEFASAAGIDPRGVGMCSTLDAALAAAKAALTRKQMMQDFLMGELREQRSDKARGDAHSGSSKQQHADNHKRGRHGSPKPEAGEAAQPWASGAPHAGAGKAGKGASRKPGGVPSPYRGPGELPCPAPPDTPPAEVAFKLLVCNYPELLLYMLDPSIAAEVDTKIVALRNAGLGQLDVGMALVTCPGFFQADVHKSLVPKLHILRSAGFSEAELRGLLVACPTLLQRSKRSLQRTLTFLHKVVGAAHSDILVAPQVLAADVITELGPAYAYLCMRFPYDVTHPEEDGPLHVDDLHTAPTPQPARTPPTPGAARGRPPPSPLPARSPRTHAPRSSEARMSSAGSLSGPDDEEGGVDGRRAGETEEEAVRRSERLFRAVSSRASAGGGPRAKHPLWVQLCSAEGRLRLGLLLALSRGADVVVGDAGAGGVRLEKLPPWFDGAAYEMASQDWKEGPGKGWRK